jgi:uncharacterized membrane protein
LGKERLLAFTDGVVAIIVTIMVLELHAPHETSLAALAAVLPPFLSYVLSFVSVGIYWNNHHHFFHLVRHVDGLVLWANLHLLFWLSLIPFATAWVGENHLEALPTAVYGLSFLMPAVAWYAMQWAILRNEGRQSPLARAIGRDLKGKISPFIYLAGIGFSFLDARIAIALYWLVALLWLVPDRRVERLVRGS